MKSSVFYFDDEVVLLELFVEMFGMEFEVRTASTLIPARQMMRQCPDIIISDWSMPEISGVEFLREAAEKCPGSFRIMLTGHASAGDMLGEISSGVVQLFIPKPWTEVEMREALERALILSARPRRRAP